MNTNSNGVNQEKITRDEPKCLRDSGKQFSSIQAGPSDGAVFNAMYDWQF